MSLNAAWWHFKLLFFSPQQFARVIRISGISNFSWCSGALVGQSAVELDAADILSDTRHNWARVLASSPGCKTDFLSFCHYSAHSSFCPQPCDGVSHAKMQEPKQQLPPTQSPTHILYRWHSPPPVMLAENEGEMWRWAWVSENNILALHITAHVKRFHCHVSHELFKALFMVTEWKLQHFQTIERINQTNVSSKITQEHESHISPFRLSQRSCGQSLTPADTHCWIKHQYLFLMNGSPHESKRVAMETLHWVGWEWRQYPEKPRNVDDEWKWILSLCVHTCI